MWLSSKTLKSSTVYHLQWLLSLFQFFSKWDLLSLINLLCSYAWPSQIKDLFPLDSSGIKYLYILSDKAANAIAFLFPTSLLQGPNKYKCKCFALSASKKNFWSFALLSLTVLILTVLNLTFPSLALKFPSLILIFPSLVLKFSSLALHVLELRIFEPHDSKPYSYGSKCHGFRPCFHVFKPRSHIFKPHFSSFTLLGLILLAFYTFLTLILLYQIFDYVTLVLF